MLYNQLIPTVTIVATTIFLVSVLSLSAFTGSALAQAESMNQSMYNATDSATQTVPECRSIC